MRYPRGPHPVALLVVAAFAVPEVLRRCKPLAKSVGDFLVKTGEEVKKLAGTEDDSTAPNEVMNEAREAEAEEKKEEAEKREEARQEEYEVVDETEDVQLDTVSPTGHHEVEAEIAAEAKGDREAPEQPANPPEKPKKAAEKVAQPQNPKQPKVAKPA